MCRSNNKAEILAQREEQLWQRQEALWQQQLAHWQHERTTWAQREAALLAHIQELHSHLTATSIRQIQNPNIAPPAPPSTQSAQGIHNDLWQQSDVAATAPSSSISPQLEYSPPVEASAPPDIALSPGIAPQPAAATEEADGTAAQMEIPHGPPPPLCLGSDNIYWVHQLQSGLMDQGYYCGEEELEDFIFAEGTQSAVLAFQVMSCRDSPWQCCIGMVARSYANCKQDGKSAIRCGTQMLVCCQSVFLLNFASLPKCLLDAKHLQSICCRNALVCNSKGIGALYALCSCFTGLLWH